MLKEIEWPDNLQYRSGTDREPLEFYLNAFSNSISADILLGYLSFSAIRVLALGFAQFISNGGRLRIVANHILSKEDKETLLMAREPSPLDDLFDLSDILTLKTRLDEYGRHFFECVAWLIKNKRIQIVIIRPKGSKGISHYKEGIFSDGTNKICFNSTCNFTAYGILENLESLNVDLPESSEVSAKRNSALENTFRGYFEKLDDRVDYLQVEEIEIAIRDQFGNKALNELLIDELKLTQLISAKNNNKRVKFLLDELEDKYQAKLSQPKFPYSSGPRKYQHDAYKAWIKNGRKGLFAMATGTGKTITSLNCVLEDYKIDGIYQFLVLVPSLPLASQWRKEASENFGFKEVIICSSKSRTWEEDLRAKMKSAVFGNSTCFCIISTYATFKGERFRSAFFKLLGSKVKSVTLIADEAHTMGSRGILNCLPHIIEKRIGLSATPDRVYDAQGTNELERFFDAYSPSYTFRYTMKEAIEKRVLCAYDYFPIFFDLTENELEVYSKYTEKLRKFIDSKTGKYQDNSIVSNLLIQRKNVIHKAKNKLPKLHSIICKIGPANFKYGFIYVPEGYEPDYEDIDDFNLSEGDAHLIDLYTQFLYSNFKFSLKSFTGETQNRDEILDLFSKGRYDAVLAMKCLDEGVDVPRAEYAIFCASTGNPRQFVQRRGRVLRSHPDKSKAIIYDLIAAPLFNKFHIERSQIETEKNIFKAELRRVINFAALADNCADLIEGDLSKVCRQLDIDLAEIILTELKTYE